MKSRPSGSRSGGGGEEERKRGESKGRGIEEGGRDEREGAERGGERAGSVSNSPFKLEICLVTVAQHLNQFYCRATKKKLSIKLTLKHLRLCLKKHKAIPWRKES